MKRNKKSLLTIAFATLLGINLTACVTTQYIPRNSLPPSTASTAAINKAKQGVKDQMKDPSSVQFRNLHGYNKGGSVLLCGEVNGKNSFGGYTGFDHFAYISGELLLNQPAQGCTFCENPFNKYWNENCKP